jgi:hypothetical protein
LPAIAFNSRISINKQEISFAACRDDHTATRKCEHGRQGDSVTSSAHNDLASIQSRKTLRTTRRNLTGRVLTRLFNTAHLTEGRWNVVVPQRLAVMFHCIGT